MYCIWLSLGPGGEELPWTMRILRPVRPCWRNGPFICMPMSNIRPWSDPPGGGGAKVTMHVHVCDQLIHVHKYGQGAVAVLGGVLCTNGVYQLRTYAWRRVGQGCLPRRKQ